MLIIITPRLINPTNYHPITVCDNSYVSVTHEKYTVFFKFKHMIKDHCLIYFNETINHRNKSTISCDCSDSHQYHYCGNFTITSIIFIIPQ